MCLSFTGIPCSAQAFRIGSTTLHHYHVQQTHSLHVSFSNVFQRLLGTDCFVHRLQMGNVHSKILLTKLCYLGILAPEHYVSIPITQSHVKRFSMLYTAIQLHFMCTRFRAPHNSESYNNICNFYAKWLFYSHFYTLFSYYFN